MFKIGLNQPAQFDDLLWAMGMILMLCGNNKSAFWIGFIAALLGIIF
jgi:hypothetical protein